jgi:hypothetical protein
VRFKVYRPPTKLDRRRERSRQRPTRSEVFEALLGRPDTWPPGSEGETRFWRGTPWIFHSVKENGVIVFTGWFRDVP